MYNEDQDLGWRMWLGGYRNVLAPKSRAFHQYEFARSISKIYFMDRNRLLVLLQNYHWATLVLISPVLIVHEMFSVLLALKGGWYKDKIKVLSYFLKAENRAGVSRKRNLRQGSRQVKERQIVKRFTGRILFQDLSSPLIKYIANPILGLYWLVAKRLIFW